MSVQHSTSPQSAQQRVAANFRLRLTLTLSALLFLAPLLSFTSNSSYADESNAHRHRVQHSSGLGFPNAPRLGLTNPDPGADAYRVYKKQVGQNRRYYADRFLRNGWAVPYSRNYRGVGAGYSWHPWMGIPQSVKVKRHDEYYFTKPRFRLETIYGEPTLPYPVPGVPFTDHQGLEIPWRFFEEGSIESTAQAQMPPSVFPDASAEVQKAMLLMKSGKYKEAGELLTQEIKQDNATLETYIAVTELLVAKGAYTGATRVLVHAIKNSDSLQALDGIDISNHFPNTAAFRKILSSINQEIKKVKEAGDNPKKLSSLVFLSTCLNLLSNSTKSMKTLEMLQDTKTYGEPAKRLYLHFLDRLIAS